MVATQRAMAKRHTLKLSAGITITQTGWIVVASVSAKKLQGRFYGVFGDCPLLRLSHLGRAVRLVADLRS